MNPELLSKAQAASELIEPSDFHGTVCGLAAANPHTFSLPLLIDLLGTDALNDESSTQEFVGATLDELFAENLEFQPLLPDDDEPIQARLAGLGGWCAGFLSGFGAAVEVSERELPDQVGEVLRDFINISGLDEESYEDDGSEENEQDYMELFEYVRVGSILVVTLMAEITDDASASEDDETVH